MISKCSFLKPETKKTWRKDAVIKISTLLEVTENPKGCFSNKEKVINVNIDKGYMSAITSFPVTKKGTKQLLDFIKKELFLK